jgi:hypothetical protein
MFQYVETVCYQPARTAKRIADADRFPPGADNITDREKKQHYRQISNYFFAFLPCRILLSRSTWQKCQRGVGSG